jgi:hypothetical protein
MLVATLFHCLRYAVLVHTMCSRSLRPRTLTPTMPPHTRHPRTIRPRMIHPLFFTSLPPRTHFIPELRGSIHRCKDTLARKVC